ncbi:MAG: SDR family NAD(P)-dependent oxidoreductase [Alphaproteobacteria bacterium]|nr:SDR family NAD(P)-dependent oxidoreductase [Alphaproteobacteria bacterium]
MNDAPGRLQGRISVITGASRGLGAAIAKRFAGEGSHVVLVARTVGGLEEVDDAIRAAGGAATLVPLDLTEFDRIDEMGAALARRFGRIDVLVGNAGILGTLSPMGHIETQVWDRVIAVNLTANWRLIRSFDPLLRASDSGRAIFVTSGAADGAHPYWGAYAVSKAALEAMVKTWAGEVTKTPVKVNLVDPGAMRTSMRAEAYPGEDPMTLRQAGEITDTFVELAEAASTRHGELVQAP